MVGNTARSTTQTRRASRFQQTIDSATATRAIHVSRRQYDAQQTVPTVGVASGGEVPSEAEANGSEPAGTATAATTAATDVLSTPAPDGSGELQSLEETPTLTGEAEGVQPRVASSAAETVAEGQEVLVLGKNKKKKLRRQREKEMLAAEAAGPADVPEANEAEAAQEPQSRPKKEKKEKKERGDKKERKDKKTARSTDLNVPVREKQKRTPAAQPAGSTSASASHSAGRPRLPKDAESWQIQKLALREKFPEGWNPRKKLSPDALEGIRALHRQFPDVYTTAVLAQHFQVSAEAVRRILKSKWQASPEEEEDRQTRWFERGKQVWSRWAALGKKPPKRWQAEGIVRDASWAGRRQRLQERRQFQYELAGNDYEKGSGGGGGGGGGGGSGTQEGTLGAAGRKQEDASTDEHSSQTRASPTLSPSRPAQSQSQSLGRRTRLLRANRNLAVHPRQQKASF